MPTEEEVRESLKGVIDAEVGINIVDLGLVYKIDLNDQDVTITMTMTTQACPLGDYIRHEVENTIYIAFPDIKNAKTVIVWDPPWTPEMMSDTARRILGR